MRREIVDRYYTPDIEQIADGVTLDRRRLIDHLRPIRRNLVACSYDVHEAMRTGDRLAARFTIHAELRRGANDLDRGVPVRRTRAGRPDPPYDAGDAGCERVTTTVPGRGDELVGIACGS